MRVKLMEFNLQDLFLKLAYPLQPRDLDQLAEDQWQQLSALDDVALKPLHRLFGVAQVFADVRPDIALLCEAGGRESLDTLNKLFLGETYDVYFVEGNSDRGIECGFLVHKDLQLRVEIESHRDAPVDFAYPHEKAPAAMAEIAGRAATLNLPPRAARRLSRDVPELRLYAPGAEAPCLILLMTHLKSGFDPDGIDPGGAVRRAAEFKAIMQVRADISRQHGPGVPVVIAGDFNGRATRLETADAFTAIYRETDLKDALAIAGRHPEERMTHITFFSSQMHAAQLDYILVPRSLHQAVVTEETYVYRYCYDGTWDEIPRPTSFKERGQLPSDHYPLVCVLDVPT